MTDSDTVRTGLMREAALFIARVWVQNIRPYPFERTFYLDGVRVVVRVDEYKSAEDTKPFGERDAT